MGEKLSSDERPTLQVGVMERQFIKLLVATERRILGYLVTLLSSFEDAEELMQETSMTMWEKFHEFLNDQDGECLSAEPNPERFVAWGCKIAFFKVLNHRRKKRLPSRLYGDDVLEVISSAWLEQEQDEVLERRRAALAECINQLPNQRRVLLRDYYWKQSPVDQLARSHNRTSASVYKMLQRIRVALYNCINRRLAQA